MYLVIAFTLLCIIWSLWVRRITWHCRWEIAATLNITLQGVAIALMSPMASEHLGLPLYRLTGHYNLEDYLGHDLYIVAATAIVYNAIGRLGDDAILRRRFSLVVEKPATVCIPLMLATFTLGNGTNVYGADFFDVPTDGWLQAYWAIMCATLMWLLGYAFRTLLVLRENPGNRAMANAYLIACGAGIATCVVRVVTAFSPSVAKLEGGLLIWTFACICGSIFALAGSYSWIQKNRQFRRAPVIVVR